VRCARRGLAAVPELSAGQAEQLLYQCLALAENRTLAPMSLSHLEAADVFRDAGFDLEDGPAVMFVVDQSLLGVAALGPTLSGAPVSDAERELLATHVSHLLIYLRNARSFETIQSLNADLERRNLELQRTIDELTRARLHIDILEKARQRIRALVQSQLQRTRSAGWLDFVIIAAASLIVGVLFNFTSPNGIALLPEALLQPDLPAVEVPAAAELISAGKALVVDARPKEFYGLKHIPGAVNLPPGLFDFVYMIKFGSVDLQTPVIVYGRTISRHYDDAVGRRLMQRDHQDVRLLAGGLDAWEEQGYGLEP
jgi:rhodanese-related sulfurtransferase